MLPPSRPEPPLARVVDVRVGSKTEIRPRNPDFRSSLNSRHSPTWRSRPKSANTGRAVQRMVSIINHLSPQNIGLNPIILYVRPLQWTRQENWLTTRAKRFLP